MEEEDVVLDDRLPNKIVSFTFHTAFLLTEVGGPTRATAVCLRHVVRSIELRQCICQKTMGEISPSLLSSQAISFLGHFLLASSAVENRLSRHFRPLRQFPC
jgi:hypothetical protein